MKRKFTSLISLILTAICAVCLFVSCNKEGTAKAEIVSKNETTVVIKINETEGFATLLDAMTYLKEAGELNFELTGGMVSSIEGTVVVIRAESPMIFAFSFLAVSIMVSAGTSFPKSMTRYP